MPYSEARDLGVSLSARGIARLSTTMSVRWAQLIDVMLSRVDKNACGMWTRGDGSREVRWSFMISMIGTLRRRELDAWADISAAAMAAQLRQSPMINLTRDSAAVELFSGIVGELGDADRARYMAAIKDLTNIDEAEACWAGRTILAHITTADDTILTRRAQLLARVLSPESP